VAPIPQGPSGATPPQFAVDDEPEDAASSAVRTTTIAPPREGDVLPEREIEPSIEPDQDESGDVDLDIAPLAMAPPPAAVATIRDDGVERVGEAVVRQLLGARFVREEAYETPTRFQ
jgi:DNA polymerase-3 subunit gamma/tau